MIASCNAESLAWWLVGTCCAEHGYNNVTIWTAVYVPLGYHCTVTICSFSMELVQKYGKGASYMGHSVSHSHNRLIALCLGLPRWAGTRRNIHPLT